MGVRAPRWPVRSARLLHQLDCTDDALDGVDAGTHWHCHQSGVHDGWPGVRPWPAGRRTVGARRVHGAPADVVVGRRGTAVVANDRFDVYAARFSVSGADV